MSFTKTTQRAYQYNSS